MSTNATETLKFNCTTCPSECLLTVEVERRTFDGSLPGFIAAFLGGRKISGEEAEALKQMIEAYKEV